MYKSNKIIVFMYEGLRIMKNSAYKITEPLSEATLFVIQDMFLTNGVHHIEMPNIDKGRTILYSFLRFFSPYKNSACFTLNSFFLEPYVTNIYGCLKKDGYLNSENKEYDLERFFYDQCHFDFIWIEKEIEIKNKHKVGTQLIDSFEHMVLSRELGSRIPVLIVHYA